MWSVFQYCISRYIAYCLYTNTFFNKVYFKKRKENWDLMRTPPSLAILSLFLSNLKQFRFKNALTKTRLIPIKNAYLLTEKQHISTYYLNLQNMSMIFFRHTARTTTAQCRLGLCISTDKKLWDQQNSPEMRVSRWSPLKTFFINRFHHLHCVVVVFVILSYGRMLISVYLEQRRKTYSLTRQRVSWLGSTT